MKKLFITLTLCIAFFALSGSAMAACSYYEAYGDHDWKRVSVQADCDTSGYTGLKCKVCGKVEKDSSTPAKGHSWKVTGRKEATCTENGYENRKCSRCGKTDKDSKSALGHNWQVKSTERPATCSQTGLENVQCARCQKAETREVAKTDHSYGEWYIPADGHSTECTMGFRKRECSTCNFVETDQFYPTGTLRRDGNNESESTKEAIRELQALLKQSGHLSGSADGIFGQGTENAVKAFQKSVGLREDGIAWPQTIRVLKEELGIWTPAPTATPPVTPTPNPTPVPTQVPTAIPTLAPTSAPTEPPVLYPSHCYIEYDEFGIACPPEKCEKHALLCGQDESGNAAEQGGMSLSERELLWSAELEALYLQWMNAVPEAERYMVTESQTMFVSYLNEQKVLWEKLYSNAPDTVLEKVVELYEAQCAEVCSIVGACVDTAQ